MQSAGNPRYRVEVTSRDELGQLAEAFNAMTEGPRQRERLGSSSGGRSRQIAEKVRSRQLFGRERLRRSFLGYLGFHCDVVSPDPRSWCAPQ